MSNKKWILLGVLVLVAATAGWFALTRTPFEQQPPSVGQMAPRLALADLSGQMIQLTDFPGHVVLLNFWASWCGPCKDQLKIYEKVWRELGEEGFTALAVATDDIPEDYGDRNNLTFALLEANERVLHDFGGIKNVPVTFVLDTTGRIIRKHKNYYSEEELRKEIEILLKRETASPGG